MTAARRTAAAGAVIWLIAAAVVLRLVGMAWLPLMDTTEARYAEIARKMLGSGDWITPWHGQVPFWGKPPLSFWLTAASFKVFGVTEFAGRLPHFLCMAFVAWLCWRMAAARSRQEALLTVALLTSSALFFVSAGAVMTDETLVVGTTLAMWAFWTHFHRKPGEPGAQWQLFTGITIGLLAKGPLVLVLLALPICAWSILTRSIGAVWRRFNWVAGITSAVFLASPWYILAELKTPGFLAYFIGGEHWHRFMTPGWKGDLYGTAHQFAPGVIWVFAVAAAFPWSLLALWMLVRRLSGKRGAAPLEPQDNAWHLYLACWALAPLVFFTFARNVIWTYVLPALPAMALMAAAWLRRTEGAIRPDRVAAACLVATLAGATVFTAHFYREGNLDAKSAKSLVSVWRAKRAAGEPLIFVGSQIHSASFYSQGQVKFATTAGEALRLLGVRSGFIAVDTDQAGAMESGPAIQVQVLGRYGGRDLLRVSQPLQSAAQ